MDLIFKFPFWWKLDTQDLILLMDRHQRFGAGLTKKTIAH